MNTSQTANLDINVKFSELKIPVIPFVISLAIMQAAFFGVVYAINLYLSELLTQLDIAFISTEGLMLLASDMWFIAAIFMISSFVFGKVISQSSLPLFVLAIYPLLVIMISFARDVSSIMVTVIIAVVAYFVIKANFVKAETKELRARSEKIHGYK